MDKRQLLTIVVTATVSLIVREVGSWLLASAKLLSASDTTKAKLRSLFKKSNLSIMWDVLCLVFAAVTLILDVRETSPITRWVVVKLVLWTANVVFWVLVVFVDFTVAALNRKFTETASMRR